MCSYVALGVMLLSLCGSFQGSYSEECDLTNDIKVIQRECKEFNEAMMQAEQDHDHMEICQQVILLLKCVATNVTRCFDQFHQMNQYYFHSPTNCELTEQQIRELQEIHNSKTKVTVVPLTSSPSVADKSTPTPSPLATIEDEEAESKDEGGGATDNTNGGMKGNKEEHKGSNSHNGAETVLLSGRWLVMLVVMSLVSQNIPWRLTS